MTDHAKLSWALYNAVLDVMDIENAVDPRNKEIATKMQDYFDDLLNEMYALDMINTERDAIKGSGV